MNRLTALLSIIPRWTIQLHIPRQRRSLRTIGQLSALESLEPRQLLAADFQVLKDINSIPHGTSFQQAITIGDVAFFQSDNELWKTDGTAAGTTLIRSFPSSGNDGAFGWMRNLNGQLVFANLDGTHGLELWKSDGTTDGTVMVKDINPGVASSELSHLMVVGQTLYFRANDGTHGPELWKSDGTSDGTMMVRETATGTFSEGWWEPQHGAPVGSIGNTVFFNRRDFFGEHDLWKSDGTSQNTDLVYDFDSVSQVTQLGNKLVFAATEGASGNELWVTDGTSHGTKLLKEFVPGPVGTTIRNLTLVNGTVYFDAESSFSRHALWKTDGTTEGTMVVREFDDLVSSVFYMTVVNDIFYFTTSYSNGEGNLWKSDGTESGTAPISMDEAGLDPRTIQDLKNVDGKLLFSARRADLGTEFWKADPTTDSVTLVRDLNPGFFSGDVHPLAVLRNELLFTGNDGSTGKELWRTDGFMAGTVLVRDFHPGTDASKSSDPFGLVEAGDRLFFFAGGNDSQLRQLYVSDGTSEGTAIVTDRGKPFGITGHAARVGNWLYFFNTNSWGEYHLWRTDGTQDGTVQVSDVSFSRNSGTSMIEIDGCLYFTASTGEEPGLQIWKSDVDDLAVTKLTNQEWTWLGQFENVSGTLYFVTSSLYVGRSLWKTDGTEAGTAVVRSLAIDPSWSNPPVLTNVGGTLYFRGFTPTTGSELWKSDGTEAGTQLVKDAYPGPIGSQPTILGQLNGIVFFSRAGNLWRTDGTEAGTFALGIGTDYSDTARGAVLNGHFYFPGVSDFDGTKTELWRTDGTVAGTQPVAQLETGFHGAQPLRNLTEVSGALFFSLYDTVNGTSLWQSNGTTSGTIRTLSFSGESELAGPVISAADHLFVVAKSDLNGREVFVADDPNKRPTSLTLSAATIAENRGSGMTVGAFSTVDPNTGDTHTYLLVDGEGSEDNSHFTISGNSLIAATSFDFEARNTRSVRVRSTDSNGKWLEKTFAISIANVNEPPTAINLPERFGTIGDFIGTSKPVKLADITIVDDALGSNRLTLSGTDATYFSLTGRELFLKAGVVLNRRAKPTYNLTINVDDPTVGVAKDATLTTQLQVINSRPEITGPGETTQLVRPAITWIPVGGAAQYDVWVRNSSTNDQDFIVQTVTSSSLTPTSDLGIGKYVAWVRPVGPNGERGQWSAPYSFQVITPAAFVATRTQQITTRPVLQWSELPGAVRYDLWVDNLTSRQSQVVRINSLRGRSWTAATDLPMGSYRAWVRGVDAAGHSGRWSAATDFMVLPVVNPIGPTSSTFDMTPEFRWSSVAGAMAYRLIVRNANTNAVVLSKAVTETSYAPTNPIPRGRYRWNVYAIGGSGVASPAAVTSEVYIGGRPTIQMSQQDVAAQIFKWTAVEGAATYSLYLRKIGPAIPEIFEKVGLTENTWTPAARFAAGTYRLWIRAVSATGTLGPWSHSIDVTFN